MTETTTKPWYDTRKGITEALKDGLAGIHKISDERNEAGYERGERMGWWCVWGHYVFDECGNTLVFTEGGPDYYTFKSPIPSVFSREDWEASGDNRMWTMSPGRVPPADDVCPHCLEGWDHWNHKDHYFSPYGDRKSYHETCFRMKQVQEETDWFEELFKEAGLQVLRLRLLPNGYSKSIGRPWFLVQTPFGWLKIGWRKRVVSMDWKHFDVEVDGNKLFEDQQVTKGNRMVHAWGKEACVDYIRRLIWAAMRAEDLPPCMSYCKIFAETGRRHDGPCERSEEQ
jgi:hypothetical protein